MLIWHKRSYNIQHSTFRPFLCLPLFIFSELIQTSQSQDSKLSMICLLDKNKTCLTQSGFNPILLAKFPMKIIQNNKIKCPFIKEVTDHEDECGINKKIWTIFKKFFINAKQQCQKYVFLINSETFTRVSKHVGVNHLGYIINCGQSVAHGQISR